MSLFFKKMIWIATLFCEVFAGVEVLLFLVGDKFDILTSIAIGIPLGIGLSAMAFFGCSQILGFNAFHLTVHTVGLGIIAYMLLMRRFLKKLVHFKKPTKKQLVFLTTSLIFSLTIICICYKSELSVFQNSCGNDLTEEISLMNSFYQGVNSGLVNIFKIRHPYCYRCFARTKWVTAEHSAMMKVGMASTNVALIFPSILYMFSFNFMFLSLAHEFMQSLVCDVLALVATYFAAGFGFISWTERNVRNDNSFDFVFNHGLGTTEWSHPILHYMAAHRPSQLSLSISTTVMYILLFVKKQKFYRKEFGIIGLLVGLLPGAQFPAWVASILFLTLYVLLNYDFSDKNKKEIFLSLIFFAIGHSITSILQVFQFFPRETNNNLMTNLCFYQEQISKGSPFPFIKTWVDALGVTGIVTATVGWVFLRGEKLKMLLIAFVLLAYGNNVQMDPYNRVNIVFFYPYTVLIFVIVYVNALKRIADLPSSEEGKGIVTGLFVFVYLISILSGVLGFYRLANQNSHFWDEDMEDFGNWLAKNTPRKSVFVSNDRDFNVVSGIGGKVLYLHNLRLIWVSCFRDLGKAQELTEIDRITTDESYIPKIEYFVCVENDKPCIVNGTGKWTKEYERGPYSLFKRNLIRPKKFKK